MKSSSWSVFLPVHFLEFFPFQPFFFLIKELLYFKELCSLSWNKIDLFLERQKKKAHPWFCFSSSSFSTSSSSNLNTPATYNNIWDYVIFNIINKVQSLLERKTLMTWFIGFEMSSMNLLISGSSGHRADDKINCGLTYPCSAIICPSQVWQPHSKPSLVLHGQTAARSLFLHQLQKSFMSICKQIQSQICFPGLLS